MRDPARIDRVIEKLRALWYATPDQRLGQIIMNLLGPGHHAGSTLFYIEDDDWERLIDEAIAEWLRP